MSSRQPVSDETLALSESGNTDISNMASETDDSVVCQCTSNIYSHILKKFCILEYSSAPCKVKSTNNVSQYNREINCASPMGQFEPEDEGAQRASRGKLQALAKMF
ncbi:hypothetical protein T4D_2483 [Trichinella pseudospiralis]|uniref:Uncharacterized protein n=1 Tax=Trichinella pseudospiralis TaxID=6337 RepID=A0A0V1FS09_TRIPS|nr:hypothetical protein T4D_2483 [Trichinella pseudospiralis]